MVSLSSSLVLVLNRSFIGMYLLLEIYALVGSCMISLFILANAGIALIFSCIDHYDLELKFTKAWLSPVQLLMRYEKWLVSIRMALPIGICL